MSRVVPIRFLCCALAIINVLLGVVIVWSCSSFGASGMLWFVIVAFHGHLH